jgi:hypothetical protein
MVISSKLSAIDLQASFCFSFFKKAAIRRRRSSSGRRGEFFPASRGLEGKTIVLP